MKQYKYTFKFEIATPDKIIVPTLGFNSKVKRSLFKVLLNLAGLILRWDDKE